MLESGRCVEDEEEDEDKDEEEEKGVQWSLLIKKALKRS